MNELAEALVDGLIEREESVGARVTWAGSEYPCVSGADLRGKRLDIGGFVFQSDASIVIRTAVLAGRRPVSKQSVSLKSTPDAPAVTWRIDGIRSLWDEILVLECVDPSVIA